MLARAVMRGELRNYRFLQATRADLYRRLGRMEEARAAYETALALTDQEAERRFLPRGSKRVSAGT